MPIQVAIVTPERQLFSDEVDMVTVPGSDGRMGIMRGHAPLLSTLDIGEIVLHQGNESMHLAISGGVMEVRPDKVTILADTAEDSDDIDEQRAQEALERAKQSLAENPSVEHKPVLQAAIRRSNLRLKVAQKRRSRHRVER